MNDQHKPTFLIAILLILLILWITFIPIVIVRVIGGILIALTIMLDRYFESKKQSKIPPQLNEPEQSQKNYIKELHMARRVQEALLSVKTPPVPGINIVKKCIPAESIGGDFYTFAYHDFEFLSQKPKIPGVIEYIDSREAYIGIAIGDVAGHGVSSALVMALSAGLINEIGKTTRSPAEVLKNVNHNLTEHIENSQISYVTAFYGALNVDKKTFTYAKAGHPPVILIHADKSVEHLDSAGVFLGIFDPEIYEEKEQILLPKDRLFFYTDGMIDARNPKGEFFGLDRFLSTILKHHDKPIETVLDILFQEIKNFMEGLNAHDDQTLVILEIC